MLLFVSEFLTCGAWSEPQIPASLLREGSAMLSAIAMDFANTANCQVLTTWDRRLGDCPLTDLDANLRVQFVDDPEEESQVFESLCREADAAMIIAPESQNQLANRCRQVSDLGTALLNCSQDAIGICTDKLALADWLVTKNIPTIPTRELRDPHRRVLADFEFPFVVKPRDGVGSQDTFLVPDASEWRGVQETLVSMPGGQWIMQPFIPGRTLSIAALVGEPRWDGMPQLEIFPLAEQQLTRDGRFSYLGGRIPETIPFQHLATQRVQEIVRQMPGLAGYIGMDVLVPAHDSEELLIVEINPRLTTSYLGYRALADQNLAEFLLPGHFPEEPLRWKPQTVRFTAEGTITWNEKLR